MKSLKPQIVQIVLGKVVETAAKAEQMLAGLDLSLRVLDDRAGAVRATGTANFSAKPPVQAQASVRCDTALLRRNREYFYTSAEYRENRG